MRLRKESLWPDLDSMPVYAAKREGQEAKMRTEEGAKGRRGGGRGGGASKSEACGTAGVLRQTP